MKLLIRIKTDREYLFFIIMIIIAVHSVIVGLSQIFLPLKLINYFGFKAADHFFISQGGAFHLAVSFAYILAALNPKKNRVLILFSIAVKTTATVFLISYFFFVNRLWVILLSGIADMLMAVIIFHYYRILKKGPE